MNRLKRVADELSSFIDLGRMMTRDERELVAELLFLYLYDAQYPALARLNETQISSRYPNWYRLLRKLFTEKKLNHLTQNNEDFALSVARETLNWCKAIALRFEHAHDFAEEYEKLKHFQQHWDKLPLKKWEHHLNLIAEIYPEHRQNWSFYHKSLLELSGKLETGDSPDQRLMHSKDLAVLKQTIVADWNRLFAEKKEVQEEAFLEENFATYHSEMVRKAGRLQELSNSLAPFYNFLGHAWTDDMGAWEKIDWAQMEEMARDLSRNRQLRELAEMLGRWQQAEKEIKQQKFDSPMPKEDWKPNPYGKSEIIGIHHSNDISAMLPSEIALLSSPETEIVLAKKYAEKKLLTFQYRSENVSTEEEMQEIKVQQQETDQQGPIVMLIDTSGSMFGAPERVAKMIALAILNIALKQKRKAFLISFSVGIKTMELTGHMSQMSEIVDFIKLSFHGGTDLHPAFHEAMEVLERESFRKADVLVISDFVIPRLDRKLFNDIQKARAQYGTHFHSLFITRRPDPRIPPLPIFDNHWLYDLDNDNIIRQTIDHFDLVI
jgi:uncharacterized protein with von Willebrand factor type A (vWA) domain